MEAPYIPDWRGVYHPEHLPGILCTSRNMFSGYIPDGVTCKILSIWFKHQIVLSILVLKP